MEKQWTGLYRVKESINAYYIKYLNKGMRRGLKGDNGGFTMDGANKYFKNIKRTSFGYYSSSLNIKRVNRCITIFLFLNSLIANSAKSFVGTIFACGIMLDKKIKTFCSGTGGVMSSAILAKHQRVSEILALRKFKFHKHDKNFNKQKIWWQC